MSRSARPIVKTTTAKAVARVIVKITPTALRPRISSTSSQSTSLNSHAIDLLVGTYDFGDSSEEAVVLRKHHGESQS